MTSTPPVVPSRPPRPQPTVPQPDPSPVSAWAPLRIPVYRTLFVAQFVSNIGTWMQTVGAQWFLVERGSSALLISLVQTANLVPALLLSLPAGAMADRLDRRRLLIAMSIYSGSVALLLTLLAVTHYLSSWSLLVMTFLIGCGAALTAPAWQAIQPGLVPREQIPAASSLGSVTVNAARAVGPALGGLLVAWAGVGAVFALNGLSYVAIIIALTRWRPPVTPRTIDPEPFGLSLRTGLGYVWAGPIVRRILLRSALFAVPASALWSLLPLVSAQHLRLGAAGYGAVLAILGVGALLGVAALPRLRTKLSANGLLAGSAGIFAVGLAGAAYLPLAPALLLLLLSGGAWIFTLTTLNAAMQLSLAHWVRARGLAIYLLVFAGAQALGSLGWGALAGRYGLTPTMLTAAALLILVAVSVRILPLHPDTGQLDRTVSLSWPTPTLLFEPDPHDGPVLIVLDYQVRPDQTDSFTEAMVAVGRSRRRTGATRWRLYRSGEKPDQIIEQFTVPSWAEYQRQHTQRWTASDHEVFAQALTNTTGPVHERHYFAIPGS